MNENEFLKELPRTWTRFEKEAESIKLTIGLSHLKWSRDTAVVRALVSQQCDPGSIPKLCVTCGISLFVLSSAPRGLSPGTSVFPGISSKTNLRFDMS